MHVRKQFFAAAAMTAVFFSAASASAETDPRGIWIDHTGRGAVEITDCEGALCGRVVWLKDNENAEACGVQILGDVKPAGTGVWDKGWIYDPEQDARFSVELKPLSPEQLRVKGYLGTKLFSETMVWNRAPADLQRCPAGETTAELPQSSPAPAEGEFSQQANKEKNDAVEPSALANKTAKSEAEQSAPAPGKAERKRDGRVAENSAKPKNCKLEVPYFTLSFPCPD